MLQLIPQLQDFHNLTKPLYEYRKVIENRQETTAILQTSSQEDSNYTSEEESKHTELNYFGKKDVQSVSNENFSIKAEFTSEYVDFNRKLMLDKISAEISQWLIKGTEQAIPHISNIRNLLGEFSDYLTQFPDTRLLIGSFELIFENNEWDIVSEQKLQFFKTKIDYLANHEIDFRQVQIFLRELHTAKIKVLKSGHDQKEEETQSTV